MADVVSSGWHVQSGSDTYGRSDVLREYHALRFLGRATRTPGCATDCQAAKPDLRGDGQGQRHETEDGSDERLLPGGAAVGEGGQVASGDY